ncbi:MFS transporter [soil metagenome]
MPNTNSSNIGFKAWIIWTLGALFYCYEVFLQASPSVMVSDLMQTFNVCAASLGHLAAFYFYAYATMQIPVGVMLDRYGPRRLLTIATLVCALGSFIFGMATALIQAEIGRLLIGIGASFAAVGCMKLTAMWFPFDRFALLIGLMMMMGMAGAIGSEAPLALMVDALGWRHSMITMAAVGAILAVFIWLFVRDKPIHAKVINHSDECRQDSLLNGLKRVIANKQSWLVAIYGGLMFAPTSALAMLWGVPFLMEKYQITRPSAAWIISITFIGWIIGSPLLGWISDRMRRRLPAMYLSSIGTFLCLLFIIYCSGPIWTMYILMFGFGLFSSAFLPAFSIMREINSPDISATSLGFMNMMNMVGGALLQPLIGWFLDLRWQGQLVQGTPIYNILDYKLALTVLPVLCLLSLLILPFIRETYGRQVTASEKSNAYSKRNAMGTT